MSNEADTCRIYVRPRLEAAGWNSEPHAYSEQNSFTDGRIIATGNRFRRRPKILYLADRNFLVDGPKDNMFAPFGDARIKIENGEVNKGREIYFAIYQAIARDERRPGLYKEFASDFFAQYAPGARAVLNALLDKYAEFGVEQFALPDAIKVPPISERGNVGEIAGLFDGAEPLKGAVTELQALVYLNPQGEAL